MFLNGYPYTDFHEMNLDFLLKSMEELKKAFASFTASNSLIFAEPMLHDLTSTYAKNTIVLDSDGNAYISLQNVPAGVQLSNADYWLPVFDFAGYVTRANKNFTDNYFSGTDRTPKALAVGDWVVLDDVLYKVTVNMAADDLFIIGTNIIHFTVEQFLKDFVTTVNQTLYDYSLTIQQYKDDIDASELQYKNEIDASELAYRNQLAQDIADTTASLQEQLNVIIHGATTDTEVLDARIGADGITYNTLGTAIRSQVTTLTNKKQTHAIAYISGNNFTWSNGSDGECTLTLNGNVIIYYSGRASLTIQKSDILTAASTAGLTVSGNSITGKSFTIYFDITDNTVKVTDGIYEVYANTIIIFQHHYGGMTCGLLVDSYIGITYPDIDSHINDLVKYKKMNAVAYVSDNDFYWRDVPTGKCWFTLNKNINLYYGPGNRTIQKSDVLSAATSAGLTVSGNTISAVSFTIRYDTVNNAVAVDEGLYNLYADSIILFQHHYGGMSSGLLVDSYIGKTYPSFMSDFNNDLTNGRIISGSAKPKTDNTYYTSIDNIRLYKGITYKITAYGSSDLNGLNDLTIANNESNVDVGLGYVGIEANGFRCRYFTPSTDYMHASVRHYCHATVGTIYTRITRADSDEMPANYYEAINAKLTDLHNNMKDIGKNGETFAFITDLHWFKNAKNSQNIIKYLRKKANIDNIICGGDLINEGTPDSQADIMCDCVRAFELPNAFFPCAVGNHDDNSNWSPEFIAEHPEYLFGKNGVYAYMISQNKDNVTYISSNAWNYYYDIVSSKTRVIICDTGADSSFSDYDDLASCMLSTPSGYHIVIVAHWLMNSNQKTTFCTNLCDMIDAYNAHSTVTINLTTYDFASAAGEVVCALSGHEHVDEDTTTTAGIPVIVTNCDMVGDYATGITYDTIEEQCLDVITIDYINKTIKCLRFGKGSDRTFSY